MLQELGLVGMAAATLATAWAGVQRGSTMLLVAAAVMIVMLVHIILDRRELKRLRQQVGEG